MKNLIVLLFLACSTGLLAQAPGDLQFQFERIATPTKQGQTNFEKNYLIGCRYYNTAVDVLGELDANKERQQIESIREKSLMYFEKSLPYFEACFAENPGDANTLTALCGIYFARNDVKEYEHYWALLENVQ